MKIKMIRSTWIDEELAEAGKEIDVSDRQARALIEAGRAEEAKQAYAPKAPAKTAKADE